MDNKNILETTNQSYQNIESMLIYLSKIPLQYYIALSNLDISDIFKEYLSCIKSICKINMDTLDNLSYERMWTNMVYHKCIDFSNYHFKYCSFTSNNISQELRNYLISVDIVTMLQYIVGLCYQQTKQNNMSPEAPECKDTKRLSKQLNQLCYDFYYLYHQCIGTWKIKYCYQNSDDNRSTKRRKINPKEEPIIEKKNNEPTKRDDYEHIIKKEKIDNTVTYDHQNDSFSSRLANHDRRYYNTILTQNNRNESSWDRIIPQNHNFKLQNFDLYKPLRNPTTSYNYNYQDRNFVQDNEYQNNPNCLNNQIQNTNSFRNYDNEPFWDTDMSGKYGTETRPYRNTSKSEYRSNEPRSSKKTSTSKNSGYKSRLSKNTPKSLDRDYKSRSCRNTSGPINCPPRSSREDRILKI